MEAALNGWCAGDGDVNTSSNKSACAIPHHIPAVSIPGRAGLEAWLRKAGFSDNKLNRVLEACDAGMVESVQDLRDCCMHEE